MVDADCVEDDVVALLVDALCVGANHWQFFNNSNSKRKKEKEESKAKQNGLKI